MQSVKVLVVEDEGVIARDIRNMLKKQGYAVTAIVPSGKIAIEKVAETHPDLVLMDIVLKGEIDGIEAAEQISARFDVPVVYLTAHADEQTLQRAKVTEPFGYILKPFSERELHSAVEMALYKHGVERKLRESEIRLRTIYESAMDGMFVFDAQGRYVDVNPAGCRMFGYTREEILGSDIRLLLFPKDVERELAKFRRVWEKDFVTSEYRMRKKEGAEIWVEMAAAPFEVNGQTLVLGIKRDITERKRTEEALRTRERFLSLLNDITRAALATQDLAAMLQTLADRLGDVIGADGCYLTLWDKATQAPLLGAAYGKGREAYHSVHAEPGETTMVESVLRAGRPLAVEDVFNTPYLSPRIAALFPDRSLLGLPLIVGGQKLGAMLIAFKESHHFTPDEIARGEQAARQIALAVAKAQLLEQVRRRVEELVFLNRVGRAVTSSLDRNQILTTVMKEAVEMLKSEAVSVLLLDEKSQELVFETAVGPGPEAERAKGLRVPPGRGISGWVVREGRPLLVLDVKKTSRFYPDIDFLTGLVTRSILAVPLKVKDRVIGVIEAVNKTEGNFSQADVELLSSMAQSAAIAIENARLYEDLHDQMEELERTQAQLVRSAKLAAIGKLAAGMAHEINSPLTSVVGFTQLLLEEVNDGSPIKQDLQTIGQEADRIRMIVKALLDFAGQQTEPRPELRDVNEIVQSAVALVFYQASRASVTIRESYDQTLPPIRVDAEQVMQAFLHIITNAIQSMPEGGELKVVTVCRPGALAGVDCVAVEFRDTGAGISPQDLPYIFDPFFTTRGVGEGMGLGLSVSHGIVESYGGKIEVESELGRGSTFVVSLPVAKVEGGT